MGTYILAGKTLKEGGKKKKRKEKPLKLSLVGMLTVTQEQGLNVH